MILRLVRKLRGYRWLFSTWISVQYSFLASNVFSWSFKSGSSVILFHLEEGKTLKHLVGGFASGDVENYWPS